MAQNDPIKKENFTDKLREFIKYIMILVLVLTAVPSGCVLLREYLNWKPITEKEYLSSLQFIIFFTIGVWLLSKSINIIFNALYFARNYSTILDRKAEESSPIVKNDTKTPLKVENKGTTQESREVAKEKVLVPNEVKNPGGKTIKVTKTEDEIIKLLKVGFTENLPEELSAQEKDKKAQEFINFVGERYGYDWNLVYSDVYETDQKPDEILESAGKFLENS